MQPPELWNRGGSLAQIIQSIVGNNCAVVGSVGYAAGKFQNGFITNNSTSSIDSNTKISLDKVTIEFWWIPGSAPASQARSTFYGDSNTVNPEIHGEWFSNANGFRFWIVKDGSNYKFAYVTTASSGFISAGQKIHVAITLDTSSGAGAISSISDVMKVYIDNDEKSLTSEGSLGTVNYSDFQSTTMINDLLLGNSAWTLKQMFAVMENRPVASLHEGDVSASSFVLMQVDPPRWPNCKRPEEWRLRRSC